MISTFGRLTSTSLLPAESKFAFTVFPRVSKPPVADLASFANPSTPLANVLPAETAVSFAKSAPLLAMSEACEPKDLTPSTAFPPADESASFAL